MTRLAHRHILLGVCGSIAAVKTAEIIRRCRAEGAEVRVVMTEAARDFVTPLALETLSGHAVATHAAPADPAMPHIDLARWADLVCIAPATAHTIARLAHGFADDLLCELCLATETPLYITPAMNQGMWRHAATVTNVQTLSRRGVHFIGPEEGEQACGEFGPGRMSEPAEIVARLVGHFRATGALAGLRVLVTAGPTREPIDPVRFIGNRSSGRMGYAMAEAARAAGAEVTLVSGPVALTPPAGIDCIQVERAGEMAAAVAELAGDCDIFISAAAVADYRPAEVARHKIKKRDGDEQLRLVRNPDILARVAAMSPRPFCVGFAAETEDLRGHALAKLQTKAIDMIAANEVGRPDRGFDSQDNALHVFWGGGERELPLADKQTLARELIGLIAETYHARDRSQDP